jgi:hypothetical protein
MKIGFHGLLIAFGFLGVGCAETFQQLPSESPKMSAAARPSTSNPEMSSALTQKVRIAEEIGQYLLLQDILAAKGNDVVDKEPTLREDVQRQGWIVVQDDRCALVRFFGQNGDQYASLYDVCFRLDSLSGAEWSSELIKHETPQNLPPTQQHMVRARQLAIASLTERCSDQYRLVMLPGNIDNQKIWAIYLIPSSKNSDSVMVGGHTMIAVSEDGTKVLRTSQLSKCFELPVGKGVPLTMSETMSDTPTEFHVYLSQMRNTPLYVATKFGLWRLDQGHVRLLDDPR